MAYFVLLKFKYNRKVTDNLGWGRENCFFLLCLVYVRIGFPVPLGA